MRPTHPYAVRNPELLRDQMRKPMRVVPYSVRSLAKAVGASPSTIGDLLTGKAKRVSSDLAERISQTLAAPFGQLFEPSTSASPDDDGHGVESPEGVKA
jgi:transcriptional regulator with XRE-family HTH domain